MNKLFTLSYLRILARLGESQLTPSSLSQALTRNQLPSSVGQSFLYRLPRQQLKHTFNMPCPVNSVQGQKNQQLIMASKRLRHHAKINQLKICGRCPLKKQCPHAKQIIQPQFDNTLKDLLLFWSALNQFNRPDDIYFRQWVSAYKLGDSVLAAINDLSQGGKEVEEYQRLRVHAIQVHQEKMKQQQEKKGEEEEETEETEEEEVVKVGKEKRGKEMDERGKKSAQKVLESQSLGRDYSFDQQEQFQPAPQTSFTRSAFQAPPPFAPRYSHPSRPQAQQQQQRSSSKGYQTIPKSSPNQQRGQKPSKDNYKSRVTQRQYVQTNYYQRQPSQQRNRDDSRNKYDNFDRKDKYERKDRFEDEGKKVHYGGYKDNYQGKYSQQQPERNNYYKDNQKNNYGNQRGNYREQRNNYGNDRNNYSNDRKNYSNERNNFNNERNNFNNERREQRNNYNQPREQRGYRQGRPEPTGKGPKQSPFIQKWQQEPNTQSRSPRSSFSPHQETPRQIRPPKSTPKIIQVQDIQEEDINARQSVRTAGRRRGGRGRQ